MLVCFYEKDKQPRHPWLCLRTEIKRFFNQTNKDTQEVKRRKKNENEMRKGE